MNLEPQTPSTGIFWKVAGHPWIISPPAQIGGSILAVHGGLSPSLHHLDQVGSCWCWGKPPAWYEYIKYIHRLTQRLGFFFGSTKNRGFTDNLDISIASVFWILAAKQKIYTAPTRRELRDSTVGSLRGDPTRWASGRSHVVRGTRCGLGWMEQGLVNGP